MQDHDDGHDTYHWMKLGLGLCAAAVVLIAGLMMLGRLGGVQGDAPAAPLQIAARAVVPAAAASTRTLPSEVERSGYFHGAPFVTDAGGSQPGPLQQ